MNELQQLGHNLLEMIHCGKPRSEIAKWAVEMYSQWQLEIFIELIDAENLPEERLIFLADDLMHPGQLTFIKLGLGIKRLIADRKSVGEIGDWIQSARAQERDCDDSVESWMHDYDMQCECANEIRLDEMEIMANLMLQGEKKNLFEKTLAILREKFTHKSPHYDLGLQKRDFESASDEFTLATQEYDARGFYQLGILYLLLAEKNAEIDPRDKEKLYSKAIDYFSKALWYGKISDSYQKLGDIFLKQAELYALTSYSTEREKLAVEYKKLSEWDHAKALEVKKESLALDLLSGDSSQISDLPYYLELKSLVLEVANLQEYHLLYVSQIPQLQSLEIKCGRVMKEALVPLSSVKTLTSLTLFIRLGMEKEDLEPLFKMKNLKSLSLSGCRGVTDKTLAVIGKMENLEHLDLDCCDNIETHGFQSLENLTRLTSIRLARTQVTSLSFLKKSTQLRSLFLSGCRKVTDQTLIDIGKIEHLEHLDLEGCDNIETSGFQSLENLTQLISIRLGGTHVASLSFLKRSKKLRSLILESCPLIDDDSLKSLRELFYLRELDLSKCTSLSNEGLMCLTHLKELEILNCFGDCQVTGSCFSFFKDFDQLTSLNLGWCSLNDESLASLLLFKNLTDLNLDGCKSITYKGLKKLQTLYHLTSLSLGYCPQLSTAELEVVSALPHLKNLDLRSCNQLTIKDLSVLKGLNTLEFLNLDDCPIDKKAVEEILPHVNIWT